MSDNNFPQEAIDTRDRLRTLSARIFEAIEHGNEFAIEFFAPEDRTYDPHLYPFLVRYAALHKLPQSARAIEGEFSVTRRQMCGIEIKASPWLIKVWKRPNYEDEKLFLHPPGDSSRRQDFYNQRLLPGTEHFFQNGTLAYIWDRAEAGSIGLWLVKPFGFENIWKPGNTEWAIPLEHPAAQVVAAADFAEEDEPLDIRLDETGSKDDPENGA